MNSISEWLGTPCKPRDHSHIARLVQFCMHSSHVPSFYRGVHFCALLAVLGE